FITLFFSRRRRHTRFSRDWSSDVCSSDLPDFGEGVTAVVVAKPGATLSEREITDHLRTRLAAYKVPKRVVFADSFPRNAMGKVQIGRASCRERENISLEELITLEETHSGI